VGVHHAHALGALELRPDLWQAARFLIWTGEKLGWDVGAPGWDFWRRVYGQEIPTTPEVVKKLVNEKVDLRYLGPMIKDTEARLGNVRDLLAETQDKLQHASEVYAQITKDYAKAVENQVNHRTAVDQLRIHVKQNILYYMQAIWDHEPPDQRFFRL
jgi:hypothetical protein